MERASRAVSGPWLPATILTALAVLGSRTAAQEAHPPAPEIARLVKESEAPARYKNHQPKFEIRAQKFSFESGGRKFEETYYAVLDGPRYVALCDSASSRIDVLASTPDQAPTKLELAAPLSMEDTFGTRLRPEIRLNGRVLEIDQQDCHFSNEEGAAAIVIRQEWSAPRKGHSTSIFRFRCDPVRGYTVEVGTQVSVAPEAAKKNATGDIIGVLSLKPARLENPWPGSSEFDRTIYTPRSGTGYHGWWNNLAVAPRVHGRDDFLTLRVGGFLGYLTGKGGWAPTISYPDTLAGAPLHRIDPETLEQQCYLVRPAAAAGQPSSPLLAQLEFTPLPPEAAAHLSRQVNLSQWEGQRAVMLRLGQTEDFEDQPLALTSAARGLVSPAYQLSTKEAHSGKNSLVLLGTPANRQNAAKPQVTAPAIPLDARSRYRVTVWARSGSGVTDGLLSVTLHSSSDLDDEAPRRLRSSTVKNGEGWKELTLEFETGPDPAYADLRFLAIGNGTAFFDDFSFTKVAR